MVALIYVKVGAFAKRITKQTLTTKQLIISIPEALTSEANVTSG